MFKPGPLKTIAYLSIGLALGSAHSSEQTSPVVCIKEHLSILGATEDELDVLVQNKGNLFKISPRSPRETQALNQAVLNQLHSEALPIGISSRRSAGLSPDEIKKLSQDALDNRQVRESVCGSYNGSSDYGFCWGRAMAVHLKALQAGLSNQSIRKLWAVGNLQGAQISWRYHVATLVRAQDGAWYAIDPYYKSAMSVENWYAKMRSLDSTGTMRLYATPAKQFSPSSWNKYNKEDLESVLYYNFFADLMNTIYTENTGKVGPWKAISEKNEATLNKIRIMRKLLIQVGAVSGGSAFGYALWRIRPETSQNKKTK